MFMRKLPFVAAFYMGSDGMNSRIINEMYGK